jgi:hypothetical protein
LTEKVNPRISAAVDRFRSSLDAVESGLNDLRDRDSLDLEPRDFFDDAGRTLKAARRDITRNTKKLAKDLEKVERAISKGSREVTDSARKRGTAAVKSARSKASGKSGKKGTK